MAKVLLVDDNTGLRAMLAEMLVAEGLVVVEAGRADDGIAAAAGNEFSLAVLDLNLPDATGVVIWQAVCEVTEHVIFMTAEASAGLVDQASECGPLKVLHKPFDPVEFRVLVREALS
ncbi:MAG: response regulator [Planctomycetota bacterium]|jgi:DNA-binding response OmpR family regulator